MKKFIYTFKTNAGKFRVTCTPVANAADVLDHIGALRAELLIYYNTIPYGAGDWSWNYFFPTEARRLGISPGRHLINEARGILIKLSSDGDFLRGDEWRGLVECTENKYKNI